MLQRLALCVATVACLFLSGCHLRPHGRYQDGAGSYIDFRYSGNAYTNLEAGGGEARITFDRESQLVTLHEPDGNPVLEIKPDGTLCCGPGGPFRPIPSAH